MSEPDNDDNVRGLRDTVLSSLQGLDDLGVNDENSPGSVTVSGCTEILGVTVERQC